jgi:tetratricopeptide (TPR) repeat protein
VLNLMAQYDEALTVRRKAIQLDPQRVEGFYNLGLVYRRRGQGDLAISAYKEALRLNPRMADAHLNLGNLYMEKGQPRQALAHYEEALKIRTGWDKAMDGLEAARDAIESDSQGGRAEQKAGSSAMNQPVARAAAAADADRVVDPVIHATFLTSLHQATVVSEEAGRLLGAIVGGEIEPVIQELSRALLHTHGSRGELDACLTKFETALGRMKAAHQNLKSSVARLEEIGERFPEK